MLDFLLRPLKRTFGRDKAYYRIIDDMLGFIPHNIELYKLALIHKSASFVLENGTAINNERLEFLGDAVIEAVTSDYLYIEFPERDEGFMTQLRSKIVSRQSLNAIAGKIGLDRHVISNGNGLLINRIYYRHLDLEQLTESETDFKSRLIEWCQKNHHTILFQTGHDKGYTSNRPLFCSTVLIDGMEMGHGAGESKKEAEQHAAFSVSRSLSDEDCASLLDKVDRLSE